MISNITAGTKKQIDTVIQANIIPSLINLLNEAPFVIRKEAAWAIVNATSGGNRSQIQYLVNRGVIGPLVSLLDTRNEKILLVAMDGLYNILKCGENKKMTKIKTLVIIVTNLLETNLQILLKWHMV